MPGVLEAGQQPRVQQGGFPCPGLSVEQDEALAFDDVIVQFPDVLSPAEKHGGILPGKPVQPGEGVLRPFQVGGQGRQLDGQRLLRQLVDELQECIGKPEHLSIPFLRAEGSLVVGRLDLVVAGRLQVHRAAVFLVALYGGAGAQDFNGAEGFVFREEVFELLFGYGGGGHVVWFTGNGFVFLMVLKW